MPLESMFGRSSHARRHLSAGLLIVGVVASAAAPAYAQDTAGKTGEAWQLYQLPQSSLVYARDGSLIGEIGRQYRTSVAISSVPKYVWQAFVAIEDQRFFKHDGVDTKALASAVVGKIIGNNRGGASTLEEQLAGYMHPDLIDRSEKSYLRKLHGEAAAREMDQHYTKWQILETYINQVNLGRGWYGVEAGARHYFGKHASQLTIAEAATLAALPKSQTLYDPIAHPDRSRARRNLVIAAMFEQHYISAADSARAFAEPVVTAPNGGMSAAAGYFVDAVKQAADRAGIPVMNGGYRIYTTLDPALQRDAVLAVVNGTNRIEADKNYHHLNKAESIKAGSSAYLESVAIAIDPYTGDVKALVGGRDYARAPLNRAFMLRQPGSSFKPFVYSVALADSIPGNAIVPDTSLEIPLPNGDTYTPREDDGKFWGDVVVREGKPAGALTIRQALVHSRNAVAVQLGLRVGMDSVVALAQRLGITTPIYPYPSSAIGASEVKPIDLAAAYTVFANNGAVVQPRLITQINDQAGHAVYRQPVSTPQQVIDPRIAFIVRDMLRDVAEHGTGIPAREAVPDRIPVAGKTGTTNDNKDLWFVGMTPEIVAAVWVGFDKPVTVERTAFGGGLAAPIWGDMIGRYYSGKSSSGWGPPPDGLVYAVMDKDTGLVATPMTAPDRKYIEYFLPGTEPVEMRNNPWKVPQWGPLFVP